MRYGGLGDVLAPLVLINFKRKALCVFQKEIAKDAISFLVLCTPSSPARHMDDGLIGVGDMKEVSRSQDSRCSGQGSTIDRTFGNTPS